MASKQHSSWLIKSPVPHRQDVFAHHDIAGLTPLDAQMGVRTPKCVPDALVGPLFGPAEDGAPLHTYAILDAAKLSLLPDIIEASEAQRACLFQGDAATELRDLSPWLVALGQGDRLTRALMTDCAGPTGLWARDLGLMLRCAAPFDQVWQHLRRFVRLRQADDDAWFYFRFWERHVPLGLASAQAEAPAALLQALMAPVDGHPQRWVMIDPIGHVADVLALRDPPVGRVAVPPLHRDTVDALARSTTAAQMRDEIHTALRDVPPAVRAAYGSEPGLADLWQALHGAQFKLRDHRIEAIRGYLTLVLAHQRDAAWSILTRKEQGPKIRLWHLNRAVEAAA